MDPILLWAFILSVFSVLLNLYTLYMNRKAKQKLDEVKSYGFD